jgi:hypothetical protein
MLPSPRYRKIIVHIALMIKAKINQWKIIMPKLEKKIRWRYPINNQLLSNHRKISNALISMVSISMEPNVQYSSHNSVKSTPYNTS